jgi:hypothetical protein
MISRRPHRRAYRSNQREIEQKEAKVTKGVWIGFRHGHFRHRRVAAVIDTEPEFYQEAGPEPRCPKPSFQRESGIKLQGMPFGVHAKDKTCRPGPLQVQMLPDLVLEHLKVGCAHL